MINPPTFRFGNLDFVAMQRLVVRPQSVSPPEPEAADHLLKAAALLLLGGTIAALKTQR